MPVIGWFNTGVRQQSAVENFGQGLAEQGFVDGRNVTIEYRWGNNQPTRTGELVADLLRRQPAVIFAFNTIPAILAVKNATSTIPIVFAGGFDPVAAGLVASINRPGGNVTGVTYLNYEISTKRLDLLHKMVPSAKTVAYLSISRPLPAADPRSDLVAASRSLGLQLVILNADTVDQFDAAFATAVENQAGALLVAPYQVFANNADKIVALAARHRIPVCYFGRVRGGLMSYGAHPSIFRLAASAYVSRILKGDKPADLPVQQPTKFELVINLRTARALGIEVPPTLLAIADEVIE